MREQMIQEALNGIRDEYITESCVKLGILGAGALAAGAAADAAWNVILPSSGTAAKAGFGAWLAKGGWIALVAGVVVAAGVAAGAFLLGKGGDVPPVGTGNVTIEGTEETSDESADGTETSTTEEPAEVSRYFQFPLIDANDTTSYVSVPDMTAEGDQAVEFFIVPTDAETSELTKALLYSVPTDYPVNIMFVATKNKNNGSYEILCVMEKAEPDTTGMKPGTGTVYLDCCSFDFRTTKNNLLWYLDRDFVFRDWPTSQYFFTYKDGETLSPQCKIHMMNLEYAKEHISKFSDPEKYEYTVLYSYIDGVEVINTPVETLPEFPFTIFMSYNQYDVDS